MNFGTGATISLNGANTLVGGDVYVGGNSAQTINTNGGNVTVNGEMLIANTNGLTINTSGGDAVFRSIINSGNTYASISSPNTTWTTASNNARNGAGGGVGDTYLATITSRLENAIAGRAVNYQTSWLGGQRVVGIGTNNLWRWVEGPEGLMDSGNGLAFFTQNGSNSVNGTSGTSYNGGYSNWNGSEPNNSGGANLADGSETVIQFVGNLGRWNDLPANSSTLNQYVRETNLADSPLTINAGGGSITFSGAVGGSKTLASLNVTASGGINVNGGLIRTSGTQTYNNDITLGSASTTLETTGSSTDFTLVDNRNIANGTGSAASLTLKSARSITMNAGSSITSAAGALNTTLWSDSDATNGGYIWMDETAGIGATINSNGGNITLSGGSNTSTGYAEGVNGTQGNGILMDTATLQSGGGNIIIRGRSSTTATSLAVSDGTSNNTDGIRLSGSNLINSGTGTINMQGVARGTDGSSSNGIETNITGYSRIYSAATNTTAITLNGNATTGTSTNGWGTFLWGNNAAGIVLAATGTGGGISIDGQGRGSTNNGGGTHLEPNAFVLAASGPINITGTKGSTSLYEDVVVNGTIGYAATLPVAFGFASPVTASTSNITIAADSLSSNRVFGTGTFTGSAVQSTGTLTIKPRTNGKALKVQAGDPSDGSLWISPSNLFGSSGLFKTGFSKFVFGDSNTGDVVLSGYSFNNETELNSAGSVSLGVTNIADHNLVVNVTGGGSITSSGALTLAGLKLSAGTSTATLNNVANVVGTLAANVNSLVFRNNGAMTIGSVGGMNGITATGTVDVATASGNLTIAQNIATSSTANNAITLNAASGTAAGTATGGNIILSGTPTITTGANGRATLYTGSVSGSTGLAALAGAGHYRYNSDESTTNYTAALGSGIYAIYRQNPTVTVTAANASKDYDGLAFNGTPSVTYAGFVNGEDESVLNGTLSVGGTAAGAINAGTYTIVPSGLSDDLGYTLSFVNGVLTVNKLTLTYTADPLTVAGGLIPTPTGTLTGFIAGENTNNATTGTMVFTTNASLSSGTGTYAITGSGLSALNYNFVQAAGNATALNYEGVPIPQQAALQAAQIVPVQQVSTVAQPSVVTTPAIIPTDTPAQGNANTGSAVGTMDIVEIDSKSSGNSENFDFLPNTQYANAINYLRMFVVDGGVRLPSGAEEDNN